MEKKLTSEYISLPFPYNLWSTVRQTEIKQEELPQDWEAALDYVLEGMTHRLAKETILLYFREHSSLRDIGAKYGITVTAVEQKIERTIQQMQSPPYTAFFAYGFSRGQELNEALRTDDTLLVNASVENLKLSTRALSCLRRAKIDTIGQLRECRDEDLYKVRNLGEGTLREIKQALAEFLSPSLKSPTEAAALSMKARLVADISAARFERIKNNLWASDTQIADYLLSRGWTLPSANNNK